MGRWRARVSPDPGQKVHVSVPDGYSPEPLSDLGGIDRGSFGREPLTPGLNISLCLSLVRLILVFLYIIIGIHVYWFKVD